jgi:hypothetical protein
VLTETTSWFSKRKNAKMPVSVYIAFQEAMLGTNRNEKTLFWGK